MHLASLSRAAVLLFLLTLGCTPAAAPRATEAPSSGSGVSNAPAAPAAPSQPGRTLVTAIRVEPNLLASRLGLGGGATLGTTRRLFNANLLVLDQRGEPQPYLAAAIPQVNTDSWRVSADGRMETTYKLKPNLTWHDGTPLTANDFVFAWQVYTSPALGLAGAPSVSSMEEVAAPDPQTVLIRWKTLNAKAGVLTDEFPPLPKHLLDANFQTMGPDQFAALPYWTTQYVAAGPFALDRWESGAFLEGVAFKGHALGTPKIDRIRLMFMSDPNSVFAALLSGDIHFAPEDSALRFQQGVLMQREWGPRNAGNVLYKADLYRATFVQFHPERLATQGLSDVRVRKALAHTLDKDGLNQGLFEGEGLLADVPFIPKSAGYYATVEPLATKYPYDVSRAQALLTQAGYARGSDGIWASPTAGRLSFNLLTTASGQNEPEQAILAAGWRQVGFEVNESIMPAALAQDGQARSVFPGLYPISIPQGEEPLAASSTAGYSGPENRWTGRNRGSWFNQEYDRFVDAYNTTLDQRQRVQSIAQMVRIFTEELPTMPMYFNPTPIAFISGLTGPQTVDPSAETSWNVHQWEFK